MAEQIREIERTEIQSQAINEVEGFLRQQTANALRSNKTYRGLAEAVSAANQTTGQFRDWVGECEQAGAGHTEKIKITGGTTMGHQVYTHDETVTLITARLSQRGIACPPHLAEALADCEGVISIEDDEIREAIAGECVQELIDEMLTLLDEAEEVGF